MAVESAGQRPIFATEETEYLTPGKPPLSRLAIGSLVLGVISSLAVFNFDLIALPILTTAIALAAYWHISRSEALGGRRLALVSVGLGVAFAIWSTTSVRFRDQYLYEVGSQFAKHYLDVIGDNKLLEAFELMQSETARQVAGTSLEEHYKQVGAPEKAALTTFKDNPKTKEIIARGPEAEWQLKRGEGVTDSNGGVRRITVQMIDVSKSPGIEVEVTLARERNAGSGTTASASWYVVDLD